MRSAARKTARERDLEAVLKRIDTLTREELVEHLQWRPPAGAAEGRSALHRTKLRAFVVREPRLPGLRLRKAKGRSS